MQDYNLSVNIFLHMFHYEAVPKAKNASFCHPEPVEGLLIVNVLYY